MKRPTMQDIADELNVSRNTVSRALRDKNGVSLETKKQIWSLAEEIGYRYTKQNGSKNASEQLQFVLLSSSFALSQTSFFGIIIDELKDSISSEGHSLQIIEVSLDDERKREETLNFLYDSSDTIDGVFILSHITDEFIKRVITIGYPTVLIDHHSHQLLADSVLTQNEYGTYELIGFLIQNGFKDIGFIGNVNLSPSYKERHAGYMQALKDYKIDINESIILSDVEEEQRALFDKLSSFDQLPEAWFCVNSGLAFILNTYLHSLGYSIPEDFSIVCFDNTEFSRRSMPPITCVGTDLEYFVNTAYDTMKMRMNDINKPVTQIRIVPDFFDRESVLKKK